MEAMACDAIMIFAAKLQGCHMCSSDGNSQWRLIKLFWYKAHSSHREVYLLREYENGRLIIRCFEIIQACIPPGGNHRAERKATGASVSSF